MTRTGEGRSGQTGRGNRGVQRARQGTRTREVLVHLGRTLLLVFGLAGVLLGLSTLLPHPWGLASALGVLVGVVVASGRRHAGWAPVADEVARFPWEDFEGIPQETVVERAKVDAAIWGGAGAVKSRALRLSTWQGTRRRGRVVVGDGARWLGRHGERLWFLVDDGYHSGRTGLVGYDLRTLEVTSHHPGTAAPVEHRGGRRRNAGGGRPGGGGSGGNAATFAVHRDGRTVHVDLERGAVIPNGTD